MAYCFSVTSFALACFRFYINQSAEYLLSTAQSQGKGYVGSSKEDVCNRNSVADGTSRTADDVDEGGDRVKLQPIKAQERSVTNGKWRLMNGTSSTSGSTSVESAAPGEFMSAPSFHTSRNKTSIRLYSQYVF